VRFPRHAKVFRGQLEVAPFAGVFFLLVIFLLLHSSLVFLPGIRVQTDALASAAGEPAAEVLMVQQGRIVYRNTTWTLPDFLTWLEEQKRARRLAPRWVLRGTDAPAREVADRLQSAAGDLGVEFLFREQTIELPSAVNLPGWSGDYVTVGITLEGQLFYESQWVTEDALLQKLQQAVRSARSPLTLVIMADRGVIQERIVRMVNVAYQAGITEAYQATRLPPQPGRGQR
jgi:biopolymer transport protein ExbD